MERPASGASGNYAVTLERSRPLSRGDVRTAMIHGRAQIAIPRRHVDVLSLHRRGVEVMLVLSGELGSASVSDDTAVATVEADVTVVVHNHGPVVDIGDVDIRHVRNGAVIHDVAAAPVTALETNTAVTVTIVHAAVEADVRTPVAGMPQVGAINPAPVTGSP